MNLRTQLACAAGVLALSLTPGEAAASRLIAPLDVRVSAHVQPGSELRGAWIVEGVWVGENVKLVETWLPSVPTKVRIRGPRSGGPVRTHFVDVNYLMRRRGEGVITEKASLNQETPPLELHCGARGAEGPGSSITTGAVVTMQVVDQPRRGRVVVRGPGVPFVGAYCVRPGAEVPYRGLGIHPPELDRPWIPQGALTPWEVTIPRAEFAAGGTFRFRGRYSMANRIETTTNSDVRGTAMTSGTVAVDLRVRRIGR